MNIYGTRQKEEKNKNLFKRILFVVLVLIGIIVSVIQYHVTKYILNDPPAKSETALDEDAEKLKTYLLDFSKKHGYKVVDQYKLNHYTMYTLRLDSTWQYSISFLERTKEEKLEVKLFTDNLGDNEINSKYLLEMIEIMNQFSYRKAYKDMMFDYVEPYFNATGVLSQSNMRWEPFELQRFGFDCSFLRGQAFSSETNNYSVTTEISIGAEIG